MAWPSFFTFASAGTTRTTAKTITKTKSTIKPTSTTKQEEAIPTKVQRYDSGIDMDYDHETDEGDIKWTDKPYESLLRLRNFTLAWQVMRYDMITNPTFDKECKEIWPSDIVLEARNTYETQLSFLSTSLDQAIEKYRSDPIGLNSIQTPNIHLLERYELQIDKNPEEDFSPKYVLGVPDSCQDIIQRMEDWEYDWAKVEETQFVRGLQSLVRYVKTGFGTEEMGDLESAGIILSNRLRLSRNMNTERQSMYGEEENDDEGKWLPEVEEVEGLIDGLERTLRPDGGTREEDEKTIETAMDLANKLTASMTNNMSSMPLFR
ncbi:hypothetical protein M231_07959 [Tremella mesenterica]|uniref:Uncharacterized protein n=1 Tax=Tremella mesenterica TaxID=5217 RepID=A0A4Q1BF89_TREME|nr:uncharacterized protein TREMEDRAFT_61036 [Tremella mesenterica DSM 1558]EIW70531.1 hypothetical protein TREMEDRAFT_61036 [Tremella mesenterica DSM 1558]RXK34781.1 hypothetical protein M231_07959 [Tremella mesenterica]